MFTKAAVTPAVKAILMAAILSLCFVAAVAQTDQPPAQPTIEEVYLAKDAGNGKAGEQVTEFAVGDIPIHCVVLLDTSTKVTVKMNFVAVAVAGVKPDTKVVTASYTTSERQNRVNFIGRPDGKWTPGRYRVDIFLEGKPQKQIEFSITGTPANIPTASKFVPAANKPKAKPKD